MLSIVAAMSLLPLYVGEYRGEWSSNMKFATQLRGDGQSSFCVLKSAIDQSSNGIEYRVGLAFGGRNEISLAAATDGLAPAGPIIFTTDDGEFTFAEMSKATVDGHTVLRWTMTRAMMTKLLASLKASTSAVITLPLKMASITFAVPTANAADTFNDAKECENYRLGKTLPD